MGEFALTDDVFYVGHSLVGIEIPAMLEDLIEWSRGSGSVRFQVINGAPLAWNWEHSADAQGDDARAVLPIGETEVVVLTEAVPLVNHTTWSDTDGNALRFYRLAVDARPDARVFLYETWHSLNSGTGVDVPYDEGDAVSWRQRIDADSDRWHQITEYVNSRRPPGAIPMRMLPAGQAMGRLHDEIAGGRVPGVTDIRQFFEDDIHPNGLGDYFLAVMHFAAIYGRDPRGLPSRLPDEYGGTRVSLTPQLARRLQEIAWDVVGHAPAEGAVGTEPGKATGLAFGLTGISDWSSQQPFIDVMKSARPWIGHLPGAWGGWDQADLERAGVLDEHGWPTRIPAELDAISTIILADQPAEARSLAGLYRVAYEGEGELHLDGRAKVVRERPGEIVFRYEPGPGHAVLTIRKTDPRGRGDHIRNISIVHEALAPLHAAGELFNPQWLDLIGHASLLRFMDWMDTNGSEQAAWKDRPLPDFYTYADRGVPVEIMVRLANQIGAEPWFTMPHRADDDYARAFASLVRDELDADLRVHVEYSNELWNFQFDQAHFAQQQAEARWGAGLGEDARIQYAGGRAAELARIWKQEFGEAAEERVVNVIATQTAWLGLEVPLLEASLWTVEQGDGLPPAAYFDAYAVAGYFGGALGTDEQARQIVEWIETSRSSAETTPAALRLGGEEATRYAEEHRFDLARELAARQLLDGSVTDNPDGSLEQLICETLPYHAAVAERYDLDLVMYEGGSHVVAQHPWIDSELLTEFFVDLQYSAEMGELYDRLLAGWRGLSSSPFNAFTDISSPGKWGSWGALRHLDNSNPRWDALTSEQTASPWGCTGTGH